MKLFNATIALTAATALGMAATSAMARTDVSVDLHLGGHPVPPPCGPVYQQTIIAPTVQQVWVPAQYQTVTENTWHDPVTQDQVKQTWVPDRYEVRPMQTVDQYGRPITVNQQVLVEPGHWQDVHTPVVVQAGYWGPETKQVLISEGHWETVQAPVVYAQPVVVPPPYYYGPRSDVHVYYDNYHHDDHYGHWRH